MGQGHIVMLDIKFNVNELKGTLEDAVKSAVNISDGTKVTSNCEVSMKTSKVILTFSVEIDGTKTSEESPVCTKCLNNINFEKIQTLDKVQLNTLVDELIKHPKNAVEGIYRQLMERRDDIGYEKIRELRNAILNSDAPKISATKTSEETPVSIDLDSINSEEVQTLSRDQLYELVDQVIENPEKCNDEVYKAILMRKCDIGFEKIIELKNAVLGKV